MHHTARRADRDWKCYWRRLSCDSRRCSLLRCGRRPRSLDSIAVPCPGGTMTLPPCDHLSASDRPCVAHHQQPTHGAGWDGPQAVYDDGSATTWAATKVMRVRFASNFDPLAGTGEYEQLCAEAADEL